MQGALRTAIAAPPRRMPWHPSRSPRVAFSRIGQGKVGAVEWLNEPPAWEIRGETLVVTPRRNRFLADDPLWLCP